MEASKFYIDWTSQHILKTNFTNGFSFSEFAYVQKSDLLPFHINLSENFPTSVKAFFEKCQEVASSSIYTANGHLYCFKSGDLQYGPKGEYFEIGDHLFDEKILSYGNKFVQLGEETLYLITINRVTEFEEAVKKHYYPMSELIYLHAVNVVELEQWNKQYNRTLYLKTSADLSNTDCWIDRNTHSVFLHNTVSQDYFVDVFEQTFDFMNSS